MTGTQAALVVRSIPRLADRTIAAVLAGVTILLLVATAPQIGLTWDEPVYMVAQQSYVGWLHQLTEAPSFALSQASIDSWWEVNHEHPPLDKLWSGLIAEASRGFLAPLTAARLGNILLVGGLVATLYLLVAQSYGQVAGLLAVLALLSMPRFFFHAHLAALDVPGAIAFFGGIAAFWWTRNTTGLWRNLAVGTLLGLVWGAGLATKINAAFALPVLALWVVLFSRRWMHILRLALMTLIGPLVFIALWPWLYHDTSERLVKYILFITVDHWQIDQWYLGASYMPPPWHFPLAMLVMVLPTTLLLLAIAGLMRGYTDRRTDAPIGLWLLGALIPLLALMTGKSMVYDNERLFMPAFPFLAMLTGVGLDGLLVMIRQALAKRPQLAQAAILAASLAAFAPQTVQSLTLYPHLLSYYSETIGGLPGAARLDMEHTYWCETYAASFEYVNMHARPGAIVWSEDWSHDTLIMSQQAGLLRADLRIARVEGSNSSIPRGNAQSVVADIWEADYVLVQFRQSGFTRTSDRFRSERIPALLIERQGVPLLELYERK